MKIKNKTALLIYVLTLFFIIGALGLCYFINSYEIEHIALIKENVITKFIHDEQKSSERAALYVWTKTPSKNLCDIIKRRYPIVDINDAIYIFDAESHGSEKYWFPLFSRGSIVSVIYASELSDGRVALSYSDSDIDELTTIAARTGVSNALLIVVYNDTLFYVIDEVAYFFDEFGVKSEMYLGYLEVEDVYVKKIEGE